jgi:hypothetical protein
MLHTNARELGGPGPEAIFILSLDLAEAEMMAMDIRSSGHGYLNPFFPSSKVTCSIPCLSSFLLYLSSSSSKHIQTYTHTLKLNERDIQSYKHEDEAKRSHLPTPPCLACS